MSDDFLDGLLRSLRSGWEAGSKPGPRGTKVRSRPSFWNPFQTWRGEERCELRSLYDRVNMRFSASTFMDGSVLEKVVSEIVEGAIEHTQTAPSAHMIVAMSDTALELIGKEFFWFPIYKEHDWDSMGLEEGVKLRQFLKRKQRFFDDQDTLFEAACNEVSAFLAYCLYSLPSVMRADGSHALVGSMSLDATLADIVPDVPELIEAAGQTMFSSSLVDGELFHDLRAQLHHNLFVASGIDPLHPEENLSRIVMPSEAKGRTPLESVNVYLVDTPFHALFSALVPMSVSQTYRVEHCHIIGGTGHGKTQLLQHMLLHDLEAAREEAMSLILIDSQGDLIGKLSNLKIFTPDAENSLVSRFLLIDPTDIDHPPALNLFDPGMERLERYTSRQREAAFNSLVDIYGRFFDTLLGAELTARQDAVFRYLARLMLTIEGATIHTLIELMDDISPFRAHIAKLDPTARRFFEKEFSRGGFKATRQQIKQRLYAVLSIPTFDRLFSAKRSKITFFDALNQGTIILVNTSKEVLKPDGTAIFGRFILSLIEHAILERATLPESERMLTYLYVDEAQDYFDETIEALLTQGRKFNFGLTLAHQSLAQLSPRLRAVIMGNTTIKLAGGVSDSDARALAPDMRTSPEVLLAARKYDEVSEFALSVRNLTPHALTIDVPLGQMEGEPTLDAKQHEELIRRNRERVGYPQEEPAASRADEQEEQRTHTDAQRNLAEVARKHGFGVEIEYVLPNGKKVDLALFGHQLSIAIEVSVTNRDAYELSNIQKALDANFDHIWMIADDPDHREKIAAHTRQALSPEALSRVLFGSFNDAHAWLLRFTAPTGESATVAGYKVETIIVPPLSPIDHTYRREQLRRALSTM